jgi:hypothetical protein
MMPHVIEELSRIVVCSRCCYSGLRFTCLTDGLDLTECPEWGIHDFMDDDCPDCEGKGWVDLDEVY